MNHKAPPVKNGHTAPVPGDRRSDTGSEVKAPSSRPQGEEQRNSLAPEPERRNRAPSDVSRNRQPLDVDARTQLLPETDRCSQLESDVERQAGYVPRERQGQDEGCYRREEKDEKVSRVKERRDRQDDREGKCERRDDRDRRDRRPDKEERRNDREKREEKDWRENRDGKQPRDRKEDHERQDEPVRVDERERKEQNEKREDRERREEWDRREQRNRKDERESRDVRKPEPMKQVSDGKLFRPQSEQDMRTILQKSSSDIGQKVRPVSEAIQSSTLPRYTPAEEETRARTGKTLTQLTSFLTLHLSVSLSENAIKASLKTVRLTRSCIIHLHLGLDKLLKNRPRPLLWKIEYNLKVQTLFHIKSNKAQSL